MRRRSSLTTSSSSAAKASAAGTDSEPCAGGADGTSAGEFSGLSEIGHRRHTHFNPLPASVYGELLDLLAPASSWRVLDLACGRAELLIQAAERRGLQGLGIDKSERHINEGRRRAARAGVQVDLRVADVRSFPLEPGSFDMTVCIGACALFDSPVATLERIASLAADGGIVMFGASYWREPPSADLVELLGVDEDWNADYSGTIRRGVESGLEPLYARVADQDALDAYEWLYRFSVAEWIAANPEHPHRVEAEEANRAGLARFLEGGREALGFGVFVFRR